MRIHLLAALTAIANSQGATDAQSDFIGRNFSTICFAAFALALLAFFIWERRNNCRYSRALRGRIGDWIYRFNAKRGNGRNELRQKIETDEPQTPKNVELQHQKTYISAYPEQLVQRNELNSRQEQVLPEQIQSQNPKANIKGVFAVKQSKSKHKANKKSKSKLKSRLIGKNSDGQEVQRENYSILDDQLVQENLLSIDKEEAEETPV